MAILDNMMNAQSTANTDMTMNSNMGNMNNQGGPPLQDKDLAADMMKDSKAIVNALSMAATETANPKLRDLLKNQLNDALTEHYELTDIAMKKGWYNAYTDPEQQLKTTVQETSTLAQQ